MNTYRIFAIGLITLCTTVAWFLLGSAVTLRSNNFTGRLGEEVSDVWGPEMQQSHPSAYYISPTGERGKIVLQPTRSKVEVSLDYDARKRGLLWYRTYGVNFAGEYEFTNPTPIAQTIFVQFPLPSEQASYQNFSFTLGDVAPRQSSPNKGYMTEAIVVAPKQSVPLKVAYVSRGINFWTYGFPDASRVRQFALTMRTNFDEINFPKGTGSPTTRDEATKTYIWDYPDVLSAPAIGMDMPKVLNAGPVAARISFFSPISLLFFFSVLIIVGMVRGKNLHPMNYFFLAAGCFAFQLLFAYLVDLLDIHLSFAIAAGVSLLLVSGYVGAVAGKGMFFVTASAQFAYMVLFSYSFFFDGLSGLTIAIGAIVTLALLMMLTAKVNWERIFQKTPPPAPQPPKIPSMA